MNSCFQSTLVANTGGASKPLNEYCVNTQYFLEINH